jgi:hypothetical protein
MDDEMGRTTEGVLANKKRHKLLMRSPQDAARKINGVACSFRDILSLSALTAAAPLEKTDRGKPP